MPAPVSALASARAGARSLLKIVGARGPVADPDGLGRGVLGEEALDGGQRPDAIGEMRLGTHRPQGLDRRSRRQQARLGQGLGGGHEGDGAPIAGGGLRLLEGERAPVAPVVGGREAVVEDEEERRPPVRLELGRRIPDRARGGEDQEGRQEQPDREQPPGRPGRRLALGQEVREDLERRELDAPGGGRGHPQEEPDRG